MAEQLKTIKDADFSKFIEESLDSTATQGMRSTSLPCVIFLAKQCPDQTMENPRCGICSMAQADESSMAKELQQKNRFQIESLPQKLWYTDTIIETHLTRRPNVSLRITHSSKRVNLELRRNSSK